MKRFCNIEEERQNAAMCIIDCYAKFRNVYCTINHSSMTVNVAKPRYKVKWHD